MKPFAYVTAQSPDSANELVRGGGSYLAGGVDLLGELKESLLDPSILVNIKELPGTRDIIEQTDSWTIGANVTLSTLANHAGIRSAFPGLAEATVDVASPQIRNVSTLGGNLAQHSRCWYFRQRDIKCLKNGGATCYAREGENKHHSIFSGNPCISPMVSKPAVALAALDANVTVWRGGKAVSMSIPDLYEHAWFNPLAQHSLRPGDLILSVSVPKSRTRSAYLLVSEKSEFDWALVSCCAAARLENDRVAEASVVLGSVAPVPYERDEVNSYLVGKILNESVATRAADLLLESATPLEHNGYKVPMAKALVRRTLVRLSQ
jgi:xanthine dehydrogenase YagS FAD-binding subunit